MKKVMSGLTPPLDVPTLQSVPAITTAQMRQVDRAMIEDYGISLERMMENAGRNLAELARYKLGGQVQAQKIVVLAGPGNNGGGGMVAARHLYNWGAEVSVVVAARPSSSRVASVQLGILRAMNVPIVNPLTPEEIQHAALLLDALIGYGLAGAPRGESAEWIRLANASHKPILALDTPSGLDTTTGEIFEPCISAQATLTLALPKTGLYAADAARVIGELYVADISVPRALFTRLGVEVPNLFRTASVIRVR